MPRFFISRELILIFSLRRIFFSLFDKSMLLSSFLLSTLFFLLSACTGSSTGSLASETLPETATSLTISPVTKLVTISGTATFEANGGQEPYVFDLYYGSGTVTGSEANGTYQAPQTESTAVIRVQDANGASAYGTIEVTNAPLIQPASKTLAVGNKFSFTVLNGKAPFTFSIVSGEGTIDSATGSFTAGNNPGTAVIRVTDSAELSSEAQVTINGPLVFTTSATYIQREASVTLAAAGAVPPYKFSIASGGGSIDSESGQYTAPAEIGSVALQVTDSIGNFNLLFLTITNSLNISPSVALIAKGSQLSFHGIDGAPPYSYEVVVGGVGTIGVLSGQYLAPATTGTAVIRVTDALTQTSEAYVTVTNTLSFSVANLTLAVGNTIDVSTVVTGGLAPLTYTVPTSNGSISGSNYTAPNVPGIYTITVSDSQAPDPNSLNSTVFVNPALSLSPSATVMMELSTKSFSASGGVPPYTYTVKSGGGTIVAATGLYTAPSGTGTVEIEVTDVRNNSATASISIQNVLTINPESKILNSTESFLFTATGGVSPYTFSISSTGNGGYINSSSGLYTAPAAPGLATVRVTDVVGNYKEALVTILNPLSISPLSVAMSKNSSITFIVTGGVGPYRFSVDSGAGSINASGVYNSGAIGGSASILVADAMNNTVTATVTIYEGLAISPFTKTLAVNQTFTFSATGGKPGYTYSLFSGVGSVSPTSGAYSSSTPGSAVVRVTDGDGNTSDAAVTVNSALVISPTSKTLSINNTTTFSAAGGIPPYKFTKFSGIGTVTNGGDYTAPDTSGSAVVRVTDSADSTADANITINSALSISPATVTVAAGGTQLFTGVGGLSPYSYTINTGGGTLSGATYTAPAIATGATVIIKVTDSLTNIALATVTVPPINVAIGVPNSSDLVTASNQANFAVSGTCSDSGRVVTITATGGATASPTCISGSWSASLNLTSATSSSVTITANHANINGVPAAAATVTIVKGGFDTTPPAKPSVLSLNTPTTSPNRVVSPIIQVGGVFAGDTVKLFTDNNCTSMAASGVTASTSILLTTTTSLAEGNYVFYANSTDPSGNVSQCSTANVSYQVDLSFPVVTSASASAGNGPYKAGDSFTISLKFSKVVNVIGTPVLALLTGRAGAQATYISGTGENTLVFGYTVTAPDATSDLTYSSTTALSLAGGSIKSLSGTDADLTLPSLGGAGSLSANQQIVIDTTAPGVPYNIAVGLWSKSTSASPNITFSAGIEGGTGILKHQIQVVLGSNTATVLKSWSDFTSGSPVTGLTLTNNTQYKVQIKTIDNVGNESVVATSTNGWTVDTDTPSIPINITMGTVPYGTSSSPAFNWDTSIDAISGISHYQVQIYRAGDNSVVGSLTTLAQGAAVTGLNLDGNGIQYYYKVKAVDSAGNISSESAASTNWSLNFPITLEMHMDGTNNSTSFVDQKGNTISHSVSGSVHSTAESKFGGASGYFNRTGVLAISNSTSQYSFGTGDFTIETWIKPIDTSSPAYGYILGTWQWQSGYKGGWTMLRYNTGAFAFVVDGTTGTSAYNTLTTPTGAAMAGSWTHVAVVRYNGTLSIYVNGISVTSVANTTNMIDPTHFTNNLRIGCMIGDGGAYGSCYQGYLDDLQIIKGAAKYTSNFTPPAAALPNN